MSVEVFASVAVAIHEGLAVGGTAEQCSVREL
jgi:hypothetical protein